MISLKSILVELYLTRHVIDSPFTFFSVQPQNGEGILRPAGVPVCGPRAGGWYIQGKREEAPEVLGGGGVV